MCLRTLDWTTGKMKLYDGKRSHLLTKVELLDAIADMADGDILVGEYAHFGVPQVGMSRAQPFTQDELLKLYDKCMDSGIKLRLFPQQSTPRALNRFEGHKMGSAKDPDPDAEAIWELLQEYPEISLMTTPVDFMIHAKRDEGYKIIARLNRMLNLVRGCGKEGYMQKNDAIWQFLQDHLEDIAKELSPTTLSAFNLGEDGRYKKTGLINFNQIKLAQIYSVLAIILEHDGSKKVRAATKKLPGWKFVKRYVIRMSPFHLKGGLLRSNLYWHGLRHWVAAQAAAELGMESAREFKALYRGGYFDEKKDRFVNRMTHKEEQIYLKYRRLYCKAIKELYCAFKRKLEEN